MFIEECRRFLEYLRAVRNASEHTVRNYAIDLDCFATFLENTFFSPSEKDPGNKRCSLYASLGLPARSPIAPNGATDPIALDRIDRKMIREFLADLSRKNQKKRTIARRLSSIKSFFKYERLHGRIEIDPTDELESPKLDRTLPVSLSYERIKHLFSLPDIDDYLGFRDRTVMELFYSSGLRVSELVGLNRPDFDETGLTIKIRGKGKKERITPLTKNATVWIKTYLEHPERHLKTRTHGPETDREAIFLNKFGSRLTVRSVDRRFNVYLRESGLDETVTPHTIRHTIATHWLEAGMDIKTIQMLLNHQALSTTTIYTQVSSALKKKVYKETHPRA